MVAAFVFDLDHWHMGLMEEFVFVVPIAASHHTLVGFARSNVAIEEREVAEEWPTGFGVKDAVASHRLYFALLEVVSVAQLVDAVLEQHGLM